MSRNRTKTVYDAVESLGLEVSLKVTSKKLIAAEKRKKLISSQLTDHIVDDCDDDVDDLVTRSDIDHEDDDVLEQDEVSDTAPVIVEELETSIPVEPEPKLEPTVDEEPVREQVVPKVKKQKKIKQDLDDAQ